MPVEGVTRRTCSRTNRAAIVRGTPVERLRNSAWRRARAAVGLPGLQAHDLRRTFATRLRDACVPKWTVSDCLGHKDGRVTELYALPTIRELRAAVETLEETDRRRLPRFGSVVSSSAQDGAGAKRTEAIDQAGGYGWT